jgi:hypothetical protein
LAKKPTRADVLSVCWTQTSCSTRKEGKARKKFLEAIKIVSETGLITITGGNGQLTEKLRHY